LGVCSPIPLDPPRSASGPCEPRGELATVSRVNTVSVFFNRGDGSFKAKRDYRTGLSPTSVAIGDLNGDGKPDLVTANDVGTISVLMNRGDGSFQPRLDYASGGGPESPSVAIGDLNGDGKPDLVAANFQADSVSVLLATTGGVCVVPKVRGKTLPAAKRAIVHAHCRVGMIRRAYSKIFKKAA
jgi:hypothetical protein